MMNAEERIRALVRFLYPQDAARITENIFRLVGEFQREHPHLRQTGEQPGGGLTEKDAIVIAYGDQVREPDKAPLHALASFLVEHLEGVISGVHILPFFPYSSDDGFSVIDYRQVNPDLGGWKDISRLGENFRLMFDAVINHVSRESTWFRGFLEGDPTYAGFFLPLSDSQDLSQVVRPRALPLLTRFDSANGELYCWTTFSDDQVDLNYANPEVLLEVIDILLFYAARGAGLIRLDAIAYLWKEVGTPCIHLPQTHAVVKLFRAVLDLAAPGVLLITETNVPHEQNISYFGSPLPGSDRTDEAQLVYQFPLAPLLLHTFRTGNSGVLTTWADSLADTPPGGTFFNFTASHDGIGVRPAEGILSTSDIGALVEQTLKHGGLVSHRHNPDGSRSPYELNITWYDALNDPSNPQEDLDIRRFLASQAVMLSLKGVPGIYFHSLFGLRSCRECYEETGRPRSLNREKLLRSKIEGWLQSPASREGKVFAGYRRLLAARRGQAAFHPRADQQVLRLGEGILAFERTAASGETVICLIEVAGQNNLTRLDLSEREAGGSQTLRNLLDGRELPIKNGTLEIHLAPYEVLWLGRSGKQ